MRIVEQRLRRRQLLGLLGLTLGVPGLVGCATTNQTPVDPAGASPTPAVATTAGVTASGSPVPTSPPRRPLPRRRLFIMTGNTGSVEELFGRAIAQSLLDKSDAYEAAIEVSTGPAMNLGFLAQRQADLALVTVDVAIEAPVGQGQAPLRLRSLATLYANYLYLVTRAETGLTALDGLVGRRVALGSPGSQTELVTSRLLAAVGLEPTSIDQIGAQGPAEAALALRERRLDAFFWLGPAASEFIKELLARRDPRIVLLPLGPAATALASRSPGIYQAVPLPAEAYAGLSQPLPTLAVDTILAGDQQLDERIAYTVTRALFDNLRELPFFHAEGGRVTLLTGARETPVPFHSGALRFFREKGIVA